MTGTGAAFFAGFQNGHDAQTALGAVRQLGLRAWLCHPVAGP